MSAILTQIVVLLTSGIVEFAKGIGGGLGALVESIFLQVGEAGAMELSTFGGIIIIFAGISLTIGLSRWVVNWVTSFGANT